MSVVIAGCGWLGRALARRALAAGERVVGIRRSPAAAVSLRAIGVEPAIGDIARDADALVPRDAEVIVACQSAGGGDPANYRAAYVDANAALLAVAAERPLRRFVAVSSTGVFGQDDGGLVDERTAPLPTSPTAEILVEAEATILAAAEDGVPACIVRATGLYGPGRYGLIDRVRRGRLALGRGEDAFMNFCHREDAVRAVLAAAARGRAGAVYHATDARPSRRGEVVRWIAARLGIEPSHAAGGSTAGPGGRRAADRRVSGAATRAEFGLRLAFPTFADGLASAPSAVWIDDADERGVSPARSPR